MGLLGPPFGKATQGSQSVSCLGGWRCKDPREAVDRRHLGGTAPKKNLETFGAIPRKDKGWKWFVFGVVVKDGWDLTTTANNIDIWHRGVEKGAEALENAW